MQNEVIRHSLSLVFVFAAGAAAWAIDSKIHGPRHPNEPDGIVEWRSQVLGWISAASFRTSSKVVNFAFRSLTPDAAAVGARIPQMSGWFWLYRNPLLIHIFHSEEC